MLSINGLTFAPSAKVLQAADAGVYRHGWHGVQFSNRGGEPFAFLAMKDGRAWFVTAYRHTDGNIYYMNATTRSSAQALGFDGGDPSWETARAVAEDVARQVAALVAADHPVCG